MTREELIDYLLGGVPFKRDPQEGDALVESLAFAAATFLDSHTSYRDPGEIYAVFHTESALSVCAFLLLGLVRRVSHLSLWAEECKKRITLVMTGKPRDAEMPCPTLAELLPAEKPFYDVLRYFMRENKMHCRVEGDGDALSVYIDFPRFLASTYVPNAVTKKDAYTALYVAMMAAAGKERPDFSVLQEENELRH